MNERKEPEPTVQTRRERDVMRSVESLFRHCDRADNPVLAHSRACSKVGYLARDGVRSELHYLESALNERKHALIMERCGKPEKAKEHNRDCGRDLRSFQRAVRAELAHPRPPLSTPKLRDRIHENLEAGQWSRAGRDLDDLMRRRDIGKQLPALDTYGRSGNLDEQQFAVIQDRIEQCNSKALDQDHSRAQRHTPTAPGPSYKDSPLARNLEADLGDRRRNLLAAPFQPRPEVSRVDAQPSPAQTVTVRSHRGLSR
jgi:hypothetical protein